MQTERQNVAVICDCFGFGEFITYCWPFFSFIFFRVGTRWQINNVENDDGALN